MFFEKFFLSFKNKEFGLNTFYIGILLLPSLPSLSLIFILLTFFSLSLKSKSYFRDLYNWPFFLSSLLILLSCLINTLVPSDFYKDIYEPNQIWIGISNWLPYFWIFWILQRFSLNQNMRKKIIIIYLIGSLPVIISGLTQYFFKLHGPFVFLSGLITWYSRKIEPGDGMTGLFNNANYLGMWLNIIWPFSLIFLKENFSNKNKRFLAIILLVSIFTCSILTFSRNAWLGLLISTVLVLGFKSLKWLIPLLSITITPVLIGLGFSPNSFLIELTQKLIPQIVFHQFNNLGFENFSSFIRVKIWTSSIDFISQRPFIGWGSSSFPVLFRIDKGENFYAHSHNFPLEIALSFGVLVSILITSTIITIFYLSQKIIFKNNQKNSIVSYDRAWWSAAVIIFICHMFDIQYFDVRIGLTLWILLGGLRNILRENENLI